jgi:opacity protein-like surface antigen
MNVHEMKSFAVAIALGASAAAPAAAQDEEPLKPLRAHAGVGLLVAATVGEFNDYVGNGWGLGAHFVLRLDREGIFGIRSDIGFVNYGNETRRVCFSETVGCRIEVDLTTSNNIFAASIGPQLAVPFGPVQPYVNASIGFSYFATTSSVEGINSSDDIASTTNFDDATFAWQAGSGVRIPVAFGKTPIYIDLGGRYNGNGRVEYLTEGGIIDNADGSITLNPILSDANLWTFAIGATIGVRW